MPSNAAAKMKKVLPALKKVYPNVECALHYSNPLELLIATILSAQSTDKQVNIVTQNLFRKFRSAQDFAQAKPEELEKNIHSTGFFRNKAKNVMGCCRLLVEKYGGEVPKTMEELIELPGVGRKTANVVLGNAFGMNEGVCVDTHVTRLSQRIGLSQEKTAEKIEEDLMKITPQEEWTAISHFLVTHGRNVCHARSPKCEICVICKECDYFRKIVLQEKNSSKVQPHMLRR